MQHYSYTAFTPAIPDCKALQCRSSNQTKIRNACKEKKRVETHCITIARAIPGVSLNLLQGSVRHPTRSSDKKKEKKGQNFAHVAKHTCAASHKEVPPPQHLQPAIPMHSRHSYCTLQAHLLAHFRVFLKGRRNVTCSAVVVFRF